MNLTGRRGIRGFHSGLLKRQVCWYVTLCRRVCSRTHPVIHTKLIVAQLV
jgi:hypothetical protein